MRPVRLCEGLGRISNWKFQISKGRMIHRRAAEYAEVPGGTGGPNTLPGDGGELARKTTRLIRLRSPRGSLCLRADASLCYQTTM
jgi:hypothetical protein